MLFSSKFRIYELNDYLNAVCVLLESCHRKVKAYKRFTVHQAPRVLTFQLKRYSANSSIKLNNRTNFPVSLDIYRYLSDTLDGVPTHIYYELYGVLVHCGMTTTSGHYYCCAKSSNKNWYKLNDGVVSDWCVI